MKNHFAFNSQTRAFLAYSFQNVQLNVTCFDLCLIASCRRKPNSDDTSFTSTFKFCPGLPQNGFLGGVNAAVRPLQSAVTNRLHVLVCMHEHGAVHVCVQRATLQTEYLPPSHLSSRAAISCISYTKLTLPVSEKLNERKLELWLFCENLQYVWS